MLTGVLGVYKTGFTLGVVGICYSAYSLVKVRIHPWQCPVHLTENIAHTIGEAISGIVVALDFYPHEQQIKCINHILIVDTVWLDL